MPDEVSPPAQVRAAAGSLEAAQSLRALDGLPLLVWRAASNGERTYFNQRWLAFTGRPLDSELHHGWFAGVHPDDRDRCREVHRRAFETGEAFTVEYRLRDAAGRYRVIRERGAPYVDAAGDLEGFIGSCRPAAVEGEPPEDVEQPPPGRDGPRVAPDERAIVDLLPNFTWQLDLRGAVTYANQQWLDYSGITVPVESSDWRMIVHPHDHQRQVDAWIAGRERGGPFEIEHRLRSREGLYRWFLTRVTPIRDEGGTLTGWLASGVDIDERRRRERREHLLAEVGGVLAGSLDAAETLRRVAQCALPELGDLCIVDVVDEQGTLRRAAAAHRDPAQTATVQQLMGIVPSDEGSHPAAAVRASGEARLVHDAYPQLRVLYASDPRRLELLEQLHPHEYITVPMRSNGTVVGALSFAACDGARVLDEDDLRLAEAVAERAAVALLNARIFGQAQRSLLEREGALALLGAMIEHMPMGVTLLDLDGRYVRVNEALLEINGGTAEERIGRTVAEVVPEMWEAVRPYFEQALNENRPVEFETASTAGRHFLISYFPVTLDNGERVGVGSTVLDITRRKNAEESARRAEAAYAAALRASERERGRFLGMVEATRFGVLLVDELGLIEYVNPAAAGMLGHEIADLEGVEGHVVIRATSDDSEPAAHASDDDEVEPEPPFEGTPLSNAIRRGAPYSGEERFRHRDGSLIAVEVNSVPIRLEGAAGGAVIVFHDISERLRLARLRDQFLAVVSHELRSPLTSIVGFATRLFRRAEAANFDTQTREELETLHQQAERMRRTIELLLDVTRLDTTGLQLEFEQVDLRRTLHHATSALRERFPQAELVERYPDAEVRAVVDDSHVAQIIGNLLDNGVKYGGDPPRVDVSLEADEETAVIRVRDNGSGIAPEDHERIFRRYYRSRSGRSRSSGLGLGLYISRRLAEALGATLTVVSEPGDGSEFTLTLPRSPSAPENAAQYAIEYD